MLCTHGLPYECKCTQCVSEAMAKVSSYANTPKQTPAAKKAAKVSNSKPVTSKS